MSLVKEDQGLNVSPEVNDPRRNRNLNHNLLRDRNPPAFHRVVLLEPLLSRRMPTRWIRWAA